MWGWWVLSLSSSGKATGCGNKDVVVVFFSPDFIQKVFICALEGIFLLKWYLCLVLPATKYCVGGWGTISCLEVVKLFNLYSGFKKLFDMFFFSISYS